MTPRQLGLFDGEPLAVSALGTGSTGIQVTSDYDRADEGRGRATVTAGLIVLTPIM